MARVKIGEEVTRSMVEQITDAGLAFVRDDDGNPRLVVKFPGLEALSLSRDDLRDIIERLEAPRVEGSNPGAVFTRSAVEDEDGKLTSKFSDEKRARTITFEPEERTEVASLLDRHLSKWEDYTIALEEEEEAETKRLAEEAKAAKEAEKKGETPTPKRRRGRPRKDESRATV